MKNKIILDEMLSSNIPKVQKAIPSGYDVLSLPNKLKGQPDHVLINYCFQKGLGLMTNDSECAKKAKKRIKPVVLI